jgi:hypothetical protein
MHRPKRMERLVTLNREKYGGQGLYKIHDLHDANKLNAFLLTARGPDCTAKRIILNTEFDSSNTLPNYIMQDNIWTNVKEVTQRRGATIQSTHTPVNKLTILAKLLSSQPTRDVMQEGIHAFDDILQSGIKHAETDIQQFYLRLLDCFVTLENDGTFTANTPRIMEKQIIEWERAIALVPGYNANNIHDFEESFAKQAMNYPTMLTIQHDVNNIIQMLNNEPTSRTTPLQHGVNSTTKRIQTYPIKGEDWEIDGLLMVYENVKKAAWAYYTPTNINNMPAFTEVKTNHRLLSQIRSYRVDGKQTNERAALQAIAALLQNKVDANNVNNQYIVTDALSIKEIIYNFEYKHSETQRNKTAHRDIIRNIRELIKKLKGKIHFEHIYSHQDDGKHIDETRRTKIDKQRKDFDNDQLYDILIRGNKIVDHFAKKATERAWQISHTDTRALANVNAEHRNWTTHPTEHTDTIYISDKNGELVDTPIHSFIRNDTQKSIVDDRSLNEKKQQRERYLQFLPRCDVHRSFKAGARRSYKQHRTYTTLFKLRTHSQNTIKKQSEDATKRDYTDAYRSYLKELYPDPFCHHCKLQVKHSPQQENSQEPAYLEEIDNTMHMATCLSRESRNVAAIKLWKDAYKLISNAQDSTAVIYNLKQEPPLRLPPQFLVPFAIRTPEVLQQKLDCSANAGRSGGSLRRPSGRCRLSR